MKLETKNIKWFVLLVLVIVGFFVYFNSFSNKLFWDDDDGITNNVYIKDLAYLPKYFSQNLIAGSGQTSNYYRPLVLTSFAITYHFFGLNPLGYHLVNLFWHIMAAWLVFLFLYQLSKRHWLSCWPALFFLVHPLQTEAVTYVSGLADPMSAVFILLSCLFYVLFRQQKAKYYLMFSVLAFLLALLSKEQSITLPALILMIEFLFFFKKTEWKKSLVLFLPFALLSAAYFLARVSFLNFNDILSGVSYAGVYDSSLKIRLLTFTWVFIKYLSLLFAPFNLHMAYEVMPITSIFSWSVLGFILAMAVIIYLGKEYLAKNKLIVFGLAWFLILLLPRTNIISINRPLYEHWLYLPMIGFWLVVILLIEKIKIKKEIIIIFLSLLSLYFITLTIKRNFDWRDPITFYEKNLTYTPNSFIQHNNLGMAYADAGRLDDAARQYQTAIAISDTYPQVHYNLANVLVAQNKIKEAEVEYYKAIDISPEFSLPYINLIKIAILSKDETKLQTILAKLKSNFSEDYYLTQAFYAYYSLGNYDRARDIGLEFINKYPDNNQIGLMLLQMR